MGYLKSDVFRINTSVSLEKELPIAFLLQSLRQSFHDQQTSIACHNHLLVIVQHQINFENCTLPYQQPFLFLQNISSFFV